MRMAFFGATDDDLKLVCWSGNVCCCPLVRGGGGAGGLNMLVAVVGLFRISVIDGVSISLRDVTRWKPIEPYFREHSFQFLQKLQKIFLNF